MTDNVTEIKPVKPKPETRAQQAERHFQDIMTHLIENRQNHIPVLEDIKLSLVRLRELVNLQRQDSDKQHLDRKQWLQDDRHKHALNRVEGERHVNVLIIGTMIRTVVEVAILAVLCIIAFR